MREFERTSTSEARARRRAGEGEGGQIRRTIYWYGRVKFLGESVLQMLVRRNAPTGFVCLRTDARLAVVATTAMSGKWRQGNCVRDCNDDGLMAAERGEELASINSSLTERGWYYYCYIYFHSVHFALEVSLQRFHFVGWR